MSNGIALVVALLLSAAATAHVAAQETPRVRVVRYGDDRLVGIREVDVLVTRVATTSTCDVDVLDVQRRAVAALGRENVGATVSAKGRSWFYSIVVDIRSQQTATECGTVVTTELVAEVAGIPEADRGIPDGGWGSLLVGPMPLIRDMALVIRPAVEHDAAVQQAIETHVAAIAARIRSKNP